MRVSVDEDGEVVETFETTDETVDRSTSVRPVSFISNYVGGPIELLEE